MAAFGSFLEEAAFGDWELEGERELEKKKST